VIAFPIVPCYVERLRQNMQKLLTRVGSGPSGSSITFDGCAIDSCGAGYGPSDLRQAEEKNIESVQLLVGRAAGGVIPTFFRSPKVRKVRTLQYPDNSRYTVCTVLVTISP
jgi:hypothetical protein